MTVNHQPYLSLLNLQGTPGFRTHAGRVVTVLNDAVTCLDKDDHMVQLESMWTRIGETHNRRKISQQAFNVSEITVFSSSNIV